MTCTPEQMVRVRAALHADAQVHRQAGWSRERWLDRAIQDEAIVDAYGGDLPKLWREVNAMSHMVWGRR